MIRRLGNYAKLNRTTRLANTRTNAATGQSIVEMAMLAPFLVILLLAIFEMSQVFTTYIALVNAAREGGVYASLYPELSDATRTPANSELYRNYVERVKGEAVAAGLSMNELIIERPVARTPIIATQPITVTIHYRLSTFSSTASVPIFGRMGLPEYYMISYATVFPIRQVQ